jgi:hypothetical protein
MAWLTQDAGGVIGYCTLDDELDRFVLFICRVESSFVRPGALVHRHFSERFVVVEGG